MQMVQVVFMTVLVFFVIVTIHEWGHYFFAKRAGILVREFAIGFGPKLFSVKRGETRYTLRLIPAGGFVRMAGEDPELVEVQPGQTIAVRLKDNAVTRFYLDRLDERANVIRGEVEAIDIENKLYLTLASDGVSETYQVHPEALLVSKGRETQIAPLNRQFGSKTVGQRALAIFAGPVMNFVLAFALFALFITLHGVPMENPDRLLADFVDPKMPAAAGGLKEGDVIYSIDGVPIGIDNRKMVDMIEKSPDKPMKWIVFRENQRLELTITPKLTVIDEEKMTTAGKVGVAPAYPTRPASFTETFGQAGIYMKEMTIRIFEGFKKLIIGDFKLDDLGGPVRTAQVTGEIAAKGFTELVSWAALLSLYLGIFNLLPIPALDGSRLLFLGIEAVRRKPINPNRESMVHFVGFALLMLLMLAVTYNDILRLVRGE